METLTALADMLGMDVFSLAIIGMFIGFPVAIGLLWWLAGLGWMSRRTASFGPIFSGPIAPLDDILLAKAEQKIQDDIEDFSSFEGYAENPYALTPKGRK